MVGVDGNEWQFYLAILKDPSITSFVKKVKFPVTKCKLSQEILNGNPWPQSPSCKQRHSPFGQHLYFSWALQLDKTYAALFQEVACFQFIGYWP